MVEKYKVAFWVGLASFAVFLLLRLKIVAVMSFLVSALLYTYFRRKEVEVLFDERTQLLSYKALNYSVTIYAIISLALWILSSLSLISISKSFLNGFFAGLAIVLVSHYAIYSYLEWKSVR